MVTKITTIKCPFCGSEKVSKNDHNKTGKQVYNCNNSKCSHRNFVEEYTYKAYNPEVRKQVLKMAVDCTGTRATGRILAYHFGTREHKNLDELCAADLAEKLYTLKIYSQSTFEQSISTSKSIPYYSPIYYYY